MNLPELYKSSSCSSEVFRFKGINKKSYDPNYLYDAVNLTGIFGCKTRQPRCPAMLLENYPDQIIPCKNKLYFRYGNILKEIISDNNKNLYESGTVFKLNNISNSPDRILIFKDNVICVLPDGIQLCAEDDTWHLFGSDYSIKAALPFKDSRTLFYTSGLSGTEPCEESYLLEVGNKIKFSWLADSEFTIISVDETYTYSSGAEMFEGTRIILDKAVSNWNSLPSNASMMYSVPKNRPLFYDIKLGYNDELYFSGNILRFLSTDSYYHYHISFLNQLHVGQALTINGSGKAQNNKTVHIKEIYEDAISFEETFFPYIEAEGNEITLTPIIPKMDFAVMVDDRLMGADNSSKTFWVSRQNEPFVFYKNPSLPEDSWYCSYDDEVTGITIFKDSLICFQNEGGFRLFGSSALNFSTTQLPISGISNKSKKSLTKANDTMFYASQLGIMKYNGSSDSIISLQLPDDLWIKCGAGYKGNYYALADGRIWVYQTDKDIWWSENAEDIKEIFTAFGNLFLCSQQTIYCSVGGNASIEWQLETAELPYKDHSTIKPLNCRLKINSPTGCIIQVYMRRRGHSMWEALTSYSIGKEQTLNIPLKKTCCEGFFVRIEGIGEINIQEMQINYRRIS